MKIYFRSLLLLCLPLLAVQAQAQDYPEANNIYRIMRARSSYSKYCIEDMNRVVASITKYQVVPYEMDNHYQEWAFTPVPDKTDVYKIRNRLSGYYLTPEVKTVDCLKGTYGFVLGTKNAKDMIEWDVTPIEDGQVIISSIDQHGVRRYLCASDTTYAPTVISSIKQAKGSRLAWRLVDASLDPAGIGTAKTGKIHVSVLDGKIIVAGTDRYRLYDVQGRQLDPEKRLNKGTYIVTAAGDSHKVIIN